MIETPAHHGATSVRRGLLLMLAMLPAVAQACRGGDSGETAIFRCEASHGKKYIELCLNDGSGADDSNARRNSLHPVVASKSCSPLPRIGARGTDAVAAADTAIRPCSD